MANDTSNSISALKDAISFLDDDSKGTYYYLVANAYAYYGETDSAIGFYNKAILAGGYELELIKDQYPHVYSKLDTNKLRAAIRKQAAKIDFETYNRYHQTIAIDQSFRNFFYRSSEYANPEKKNLIDSMYYRVDSNTFEFIKFVFARYGYPTFSKLGFAPYAFTAMLLHATAHSNEWGEFIFQKLDSLNRVCKFPDKSQILFFKDRQQLIRTGKAKYGLLGDKGRYLSIAEIDKVDSIRFKHNLLRVKEENAEVNQLPANYKPIPYPPNYFCLKKYHLN
jgi:tetratricopeptide (TPR) repeat protein